MNHFVTQKHGNAEIKRRIDTTQGMKMSMSGKARVNSPGASLNNTGKPRSTRLTSTRAESDYTSSTDGSMIVPATYFENDVYQAEPHSAQLQQAQQHRAHSADERHVQHNGAHNQYSNDLDAALHNQYAQMLNAHGGDLGATSAKREVPWPPKSSNGISETQNDDSSSAAGPDNVEEEDEPDEQDVAFDNLFMNAVEDEDTMRLDEVQDRDMNNRMKHRENFLAESNEEYHRKQALAQKRETEKQHQLALAQEQQVERQLQSRKRKVVASESHFANNTPPPTQDLRSGQGSPTPKSMPQQASSAGLTKEPSVHGVNHNVRPDQLHNRNAAGMPPASKQPDLDFERNKLKNMKFKSLLDEPFDQRASAAIGVSIGDDNMTLTQRLTAAAGQAPEQQEQFLALLSLQQWQESGQWFQEQFSLISERMVKSRNKRREIAQDFEAEVAARHDAVVKETATYSEALKGMLKSGNAVLEQGTPHRKRK